jgi:hypothetical protein
MDQIIAELAETRATPRLQILRIEEEHGWAHVQK